MAETLRDLVVSLSLQSDNFIRNIRSVNKQIQEAESFFKLAAAGVDDFDKSAAGLATHVSSLQQKLALQKEVVDQYSKALTAARDKLTDCYTRQADYASRLADAQNRQTALNNAVVSAALVFENYRITLGDSDQATIAAGQHLAQLQQSYQATSAEAQRLAGQCEALKKATQNAADAVSTGNVNLNKASAAVKTTEAEINKANQALALSQTSWRSAGDAMNASKSAITSIGKEMQLAEARFRLTTAGMKDADTSVTGLSAKMTLLNSNLQSQSSIVQQYNAVLTSAQERLRAAQQAADPELIRQATDEVTDAQTALINAMAAVTETAQAIQECNTQLTLAQNGWYTAAESIRQSETALTGIGNQLRLAESEFNLATVGMQNADTTVDGLTAKSSLLTQQLNLQNQAVAQYANILQQAQTQLAAAQAAHDPARIDQATQAVTQASTALNNAKGAVAQTQAQIAQCNADLALASAQWYSAGEAMQNANARIASIGTEMRLAESEFNRASSGIKNIEQSYVGLHAKLDMLREKYALQTQALAQYRAALDAASQRLAAANAANDPQKIREATDAVNEARTALNNARVELDSIDAAIETTEGQLDLLSAGWFTAKDSMDRAKASLTAIGQQLQIAENNFKAATAGIKDMDSSASGLQEKLGYLSDKLSLQEKAVKQWEAALKAARQELRAARDAGDTDKINEARDAIRNAQVELSKAKAEVAATRAEIDTTNQSLRTAASEWTAMGDACKDAGKRFEETGQAATAIGRGLMRGVTTPVTALGTLAVKGSLDFESSFASVRKTVDATEDEFAALAQQSKEMSTQVAASTSTINEVMATGGQLGIANEHLRDFTRVMIDLGNSCEDLNADEAATSIAKFANVMHTDQSLFQNIGSTIVDLGNNFATTEKPIMEMAQRLAGAGRQVGLTEPQVLGFATALSSVGIEAQMGGSAFSKALIKMEVACATGGDALEDFGKVAGMTGAEFKKLFESDPAAAFQAFIVGLAKLDEEGESAIATLDEIGIKEVRLRDTMLRAVNATDLFSRAQDRANKAWKENTALTVEAEKRYSTTESKLTNLKNSAMLFAQQLGDDLNPTIQKLIAGAKELIDRYSEMDSAQRMQMMKWAAIAASIGPVIFAYGKFNTGLGKVVTGVGKFAAAVGKAGGGFSGLLSVLGKSPSVWFAVAAAVAVGTFALLDWATGAKEAREALKGLEETAKEWKDTVADTFYRNSEGLSFFGMSESDFKTAGVNAQKWVDGVISVWTDGEKETDEIVSEWTKSFKELTGSTRTALEGLRDAAKETGHDGVVKQLDEDIATLDEMDAEIEKLLKKRQNGLLTDEEKIRLQDLIDTREEIEIKYHLASADTDGFDTVLKKVDAEVARAQARGKEGADISVYENAVVGLAEGMAAVNSEIDAQYDKERAVIDLIEDEAERQAAIDDLNARYRQQRLEGAREYGEALAQIVNPVWEQDNIQKAATDIGLLTQKLNEYSVANDSDKPGLLTELNEMMAGMDEASLVEYIGLLTQIQSLMDSGMTQAELEALFPDIDFSTALEQLAALQQYLNQNSWDPNLTSLNSIFGEALPEEMITLTTDLDMTGAQARWDEFAANPGAITTDAIISGIQQDETAERQQVKVDAVIEKYTEVPEGADKSALTPKGLIGYVETYAEATSGVDVSALTPENITAIVVGYEELAEGADISTLKPSDIVAHVTKYLQDEGVDMTGLTPEVLTATVLAYEEVSGGALTTALTPDDIAATVVKYLEAEGVDISALSPDQVEAIVSAYAEATNCDKSELLTSLTAVITDYQVAPGVEPPTIQARVGLTGYDTIAYRKFVQQNEVKVNGIVRLNEVYDDPADVLGDDAVKYYDRNGIEIPVETVVPEQLTADTVAALGADGTLHVLITPEITGAEEAVEDMRETVAEDAKLGGTWAADAIGLAPTTLLDMVDDAIQRIEDYKAPEWWTGAGIIDAFAPGSRLQVLNESMQTDFNPENVAELSTYVGEVVSAIQQGKDVKEEDIQNLQDVLTLISELDTLGIGGNVTEGIAQGMTDAGWDTDAETVVSNLEAAINTALDAHSPAQRMVPIGENAAAGIGEGAGQFDFSSAAESVASALGSSLDSALSADRMRTHGETAMSGVAGGMTAYNFTGAGASVGASVRGAVSASLNNTTLRGVGLNIMAGLVAGINAGRSGVVAAIRSAAQSAVNEAKAALQIASPSRVFRDEVGVMVMRGFGEGVLEETAAQAKIIRNAAHFLTGEAQDGAIAYNSNDNRQTYNQQSTVTLTGNNFYVRDEQDVHSLAVEIASLTKREQRGRGVKRG